MHFIVQNLGENAHVIYVCGVVDQTLFNDLTVFVGRNDIGKSTILEALFQSGRQNTDGDKEVQDSLKAAVAQFFQDAELQEKLNEVAIQVENRLKDISERTLTKLREIDLKLRTFSDRLFIQQQVLNGQMYLKMFLYYSQMKTFPSINVEVALRGLFC